MSYNIAHPSIYLLHRSFLLPPPFILFRPRVIHAPSWSFLLLLLLLTPLPWATFYGQIINKSRLYRTDKYKLNPDGFCFRDLLLVVVVVGDRCARPQKYHHWPFLSLPTCAVREKKIPVSVKLLTKITLGVASS